MGRREGGEGELQQRSVLLSTTHCTSQLYFHGFLDFANIRIFPTTRLALSCPSSQFFSIPPSK